MTKLPAARLHFLPPHPYPYLSSPHHPPAGVHHWCLLQTELEGWETEVQRPHVSASSQQPDGQQDLDPRYLLSQWKEVSGPQHDHAQQNAANWRGRHSALHYEVGFHVNGLQNHPRVFKINMPEFIKLYLHIIFTQQEKAYSIWLIHHNIYCIFIVIDVSW